MGKWALKGKPALIIIHMQCGVLDKDGKFASQGLPKIVEESGIVARQQALLEGFRNKNLPVIFIAAVIPNSAVFPSYGNFWNAMEVMRPNLPGSKDIEVIPELSPLQGESIIENWPIGGFSNTSLEQILKNHDIETVVLAGIATEHAVLATTFQAGELGYTVIVPNDVCISANKISYDVVMNEILPNLCLTTTTEDLLAHI